MKSENMIQDSKSDINEYIYSLQYDPKDILSSDGEKVQSFVKKEGINTGESYTVITREKCNLESNFDLCGSATVNSIAYPGALMLANSDLVDGNPTPITVKRGKIAVTIDLPGMLGGNSVTILHPSYNDVITAINQILDTWYNNYPDYTSIPSQMSYIGSLVYDEEELKLKLGCDIGFIKGSLGIDFNAVKNKTKSVYVAKYQQIFYTATAERYASPAEAFDGSVTVNDLIRQSVSDTNPPVYVTDVVYGREIFVKFESDCADYELEAALKGNVTVNGVKPSAEASAEMKEISKNISCTLIVLGGDTHSLEGMLNNDDFIKSVNGLISTNVNLSKSNPAYPLLYKTAFLKDNRAAVMNGTTEYVQETAEVYNSGCIKLIHSGAYVAQYFISWDEINGYDQDGNPITEHIEWGDNGDNKTAGYHGMIDLGANVTNIHIIAEVLQHVVTNDWDRVFDKGGLDLRPELFLELGGPVWNVSINTNLD